ncbi:hypothetical protein ACOMHN_055821 [Nucella lapillus]
MSLLISDLRRQNQERVDDDLYQACLDGDEQRVQDILHYLGDVAATHINLINLMLDKSEDGGLLHAASKSGSVNIINLLFSYNVNPDPIDEDGNTPLHCAVRLWFCHVMRTLVAGGADVNARNYSQDTPLHTAVRQALDNNQLQPQPLATLLDLGARMKLNKSNMTPLDIVLEGRNGKVDESLVDMLLKKHDFGELEGNFRTVCVMLQLSNHAMVVRLLSACNSYFQKFKLLATALQFCGHHSMSNCLGRFMHIMINNSSLLPGGLDALLHAAVTLNDRDVVQFIIDYGANVDKVTLASTPLIAACKAGLDEMVHLLIENNADVNNCFISTPLNEALNNDHMNCLQLLLEKGADPNKRSYGGKSPLQLAYGSGNRNAVYLLIKHGASDGAVPEAERKT